MERFDNFDCGVQGGLEFVIGMGCQHFLQSLDAIKFVVHRCEPLDPHIPTFDSELETIQFPSHFLIGSSIDPALWIERSAN